MSVQIEIESLLNLPSVTVTRTEIAEREIVLYVILKAQKKTRCHRCGQWATEFYRTGERLRLRHFPLFERPVYLHLQTRRYRCTHCDIQPTTTQHEDWYDREVHCTRAYAQSLLRQLVNSTLADVARKEDISYDVLRGLLQRYVSAQVEWDSLTALTTLGLDEIALLKGHDDFVTLVSTRSGQGEITLLAVLGGREKATVKAFLESIPARLRVTVQEVCTDLYEGYVNALQEVLPHARVVADRFQVTRLYRAGLDTLRKTDGQKPCAPAVCIALINSWVRWNARWTSLPTTFTAAPIAVGSKVSTTRLKF